jgi:hypothetical protein
MTMDRRTFVQTAGVLAVGAAGTQVAQAQTPAPFQFTQTAAASAAGPGNALPDLSSLDSSAPPAPQPDGVAAPAMKRFDEQRWILDNIIRANRLGSAAPPGTGSGAGTRGLKRHRRNPITRAKIRRYRAGI